MKQRARWQATIVAVATFVLLVAGSIWQAPGAEALSGDGMLFYTAPSNTTPQTRAYNRATNSFNAATNTVAGTQATITQLKTSPTKDEMIAGYEDTVGKLQIMCFNGTSWTNEWSVTVGGTGTTRRFDIAYESSTGNVIVAYSRNTAAANALAYRTKAGSSACGAANWTAATNFPTTTSTTTGTVQWVKATRDGRGTSALDAFIWADSSSDLGAAIWSGSAFTNFKLLETSLEVVTSAQDIDNFELQYESISGDLMVIWGNSVGSSNTQGAFYSTCNGGTSSCTWLTPVKISTASGDDATNLDLSADPLSDQMAFSSIGNGGSDLQAAYWSGTAWTVYANLDTSAETPAAGTRITQTSWITNGMTTKWILTYDDSTGTGLSWYATAPGSTPSKQTDVTTSPSINDVRERYQVDVNPFNTSELMLLLTDSTKTMVAEQLTMDGSGALTWTDLSSPSGLGLINVVPQEGFSFQYKRYASPSVLSIDVVDAGGVPITNPTIQLNSVAASSSCQTTTTNSGTFPSFKVTNTTANPSWTATIAATSGSTASWSSGLATYDFNDPTGSGCSDGADADSIGGQLSIIQSSASIVPSGCTTTGITQGSNSSFSQGVLDSITLLSASSGSDIGCTLTDSNVSMSQTIPAYQTAGAYSLNLTLTITAN